MKYGRKEAESRHHCYLRFFYNNAKGENMKRNILEYVRTQIRTNTNSGDIYILHVLLQRRNLGLQ